MTMTRLLGGLVCGALFSLGLVASGMIDPAKVLSFLDPFGAWDPSLAFVMGGAVAVALPGYAAALRRKRPILDAQFHLPHARAIDARLIGGSALFGVGWGLSGYCPGPAVASLTLGDARGLIFAAAMLAGMWAARLGADART
ncbi:MAG: YeeE/YedE family protein [Rhodoblastus sp.]|nr:MAG: YeeE/YedE family protein [Rhodoblastus sp.]